jgi:thiazole/oxazole-forming peptide maturase SagD family component
MSDTYYPIINIPAVPHPDGIRFLPLQSRAFTVSNHVDLVWKILAECNGRKSLDTITTAIREQLPNSSTEVVTAVIEHLGRVGVLADIQQAWKSFHQLTCQPMRYGNLSRESGEACLTTESTPAQWQANPGDTQNFRAEGLDKEQLSSILADIWQSAVNPKPSAVELSPLRIYVIVVNDQGGLGRGYYEYDASRHQLIRIQDIDDQQLRYAFNSDSLLGGAPVIAVIGIQPERYSCLNASRGYRTALIEVGRVIQRLISATTAGGLSALEYTDFLDGVLARELGLKEVQRDVQVLPISAVAIGYADRGKHVSTGQQVTTLRRALVGRGKPVQKAWIAIGLRPDKEPFPFFSAYADVSRPDGQDITPSGIGSSADEALLKAIAEAYERHATGLLRVERSDTARDLTKRGESWLDPGTIAPLTRAQFALRPDLHAFDARRCWQWVRGWQITRHLSTWVPVDLVFSGLNHHRLGRRPCVDATSSGVAADFSEERATERALLELIERHALMRSWFGQEPPARVAPTALPYHCQRRIDYWREQRRNFHVLDLSSLGVAVATVIMVSDSYPCFAAGAAASIDSFEDAATKAFRETELQLASLTMMPKMSPIAPEHVRSIVDHARLYLRPDYLGQLTWLWSGKEVHTIPVPSANTEELYEELGVIVVKLSPENSPLKVVRALSPKLIPLSFGYGLTHHTHPAVGCVSPGSLKMPHFFA